MFMTASQKEDVKHMFRVMERYTQEMKRLADEKEEDFLADVRSQLAAERALHIALESVTDVGNLLIDALIMRDPSSYEDIIRILGEEEVIPTTFMEHFLEVVRFRRVLVHEYRKLQAADVYHIMREHVGDFEQFRDHVYRYLGM